MNLGDYLRMKDITQARFAQQINVTQATISRYALGIRMPRREHLIAIREATDGLVTALDFVASEDA